MEEEEKRRHEKTKFVLKTAGIILLIVGVILSIIGAVDFFGVMNGGGGMPTLFGCLMAGLPLSGVGFMLILVGFKKEISRYMKNESVPVINEMGQEIKPAVSAISAAVKEGASDEIVCTCGTVNDAGSKFCKNCGKSFVSVCPDCGKEVDADSKFCNHCGKKFDLR